MELIFFFGVQCDVGKFPAEKWTLLMGTRKEGRHYGNLEGGMAKILAGKEALLMGTSKAG